MVVAAYPGPLERIARDPYWLCQFSVEQYQQMVRAGVFAAKDRVELLEGWIVKKMSQNPPHRSSVSRVVKRISRILPDDWTLCVQGPITLADSAPEPDIAIARGEEGTYDNRHPLPADIGVLMEIGDSTVLSDRRYKGELYAKAKIPEFWLINLVDGLVEVHTKPRAGKYKKIVEHGPDATVRLTLDGVKIGQIAVRELIAK